jgi:hypothetical protein
MEGKGSFAIDFLDLCQKKKQKMNGRHEGCVRKVMESNNYVYA